MYTEMVQLEGVQLHEPDKLSPDDVAAAYARINYSLNQLVSQLNSSSSDTATRSALLYMDALFNSSSSNNDQPSGNGSSSSTDAAPDSSSSEHQQQQQQQGSVSLDKLQRLGRFLKAAENLDAFQTWLSVFAAKHPGVTSPDMLMVSCLGLHQLLHILMAVLSTGIETCQRLLFLWCILNREMQLACV